MRAAPSPGAPEPFASRTFEVDGKPAFHVEVHKPYVGEDRATWRCTYTLDGPLTKVSSYACGVDAIQALILTLCKIRIELEVCDEQRSRRLTWCGERDFFGLPGIADLADPILHPGPDAGF